MPRKYKTSGVFSFKMEYNANNSHNLKRKDYRQADIEPGMFGFVAEKIHTGNGTDASTDSCNTDQGCFWNPPEIFPGFDLVHKHKKESGGID